MFPTKSLSPFLYLNLCQTPSTNKTTFNSVMPLEKKCVQWHTSFSVEEILQLKEGVMKIYFQQVQKRKFSDISVLVSMASKSLMNCFGSLGMFSL